MRQHVALRLEVGFGAAVPLRCGHEEDACLAQRVEALVGHSACLLGCGCLIEEHRHQRGCSLDHSHAAILLGTVGTFELDITLAVAAIDTNPPRITADLAVLYERATDVRLDVDVDVFSTVRTGDSK